MFVYSCSGFTITISLPTFTLIYPKLYQSSQAFEKLLDEYKKHLSADVFDRITVLSDKHHPFHVWCHPPQNTPRYSGLYNRKLFGVLPTGEFIHYHFYVSGKNPEKAILDFLYLLATQTEKGELLHLSLKDLSDLKWCYQQYCQKFGLEQFAEAIMRLALMFSINDANFTADDKFESAEEYMSCLNELRKKIEANIGVKSINLPDLQVALKNAKAACQGQDETFLKVSHLGENLLKVLASDKETSIPLQSMINQNTFFALDQCPANKRQDLRYTNEHIIILLAFIINASLLASSYLMETEPKGYKGSILVATLLLLLAFNGSEYAAQEPRHLIRFGK